MLNRGVVIVRPAQPFLDWATTLDDSGLVPNSDGEQTVYLVPGFEDDDEAAQVLHLVFAEIFERELDSWHTDDTAWPKQRTFVTFKQWFKIEMHSLVEDLCSDELVDDDV
jgi:hypothetical protein